MSMVCKKSLNLSYKARKKYTIGEITNLMSVDVQRILDSFPCTKDIWAAPLTIALAMYFLFIELKYAMFAGIGVLLILLPITICGTKKGYFYLTILSDGIVKRLNIQLNYFIRV